MFLNWVIKDNVVIHYCELIFNFQIILIKFFVYLFEMQVFQIYFAMQDIFYFL
jgi:hypothetical protein